MHILHPPFTAEKLKAHFTAVLSWQSGLHVRRVEPWLDDLIAGVVGLVQAGGKLSMSTSRQLFITFQNTDYKMRFNHTATFKGAVELVRMNGNKDGPAGRPISTPEEAKEFAQNPMHFMPEYIAVKTAMAQIKVALPDLDETVAKAARAVVAARAAYLTALRDLQVAVKQQDEAKAATGIVNADSPAAGRA